MGNASQSHELSVPFVAGKLEKLNIGDLVYLTGEIIITVGMPTHKRIKEYIDAGRTLPMDFDKGMLCQVGAYIEETPNGRRCRYINPSTSTRFEPYLPTIIDKSGVMVIAGKGGVGPNTLEAMRRNGCVYLSFIGGASALTSQAVEEVIDVTWNDFIMQFRLTRLRVNRLGPLTVGVDAHGNSLYVKLEDAARSKFKQLMDELNETRAT